MILTFFLPMFSENYCKNFFLKKFFLKLQEHQKEQLLRRWQFLSAKKFETVYFSGYFFLDLIPFSKTTKNGKTRPVKMTCFSYAYNFKTQVF